MPIPPSKRLERRLEDIFDQLTQFTLLIHQKEDILEILNITSQTARNLLDADRSLIYQLLPNGDGAIIAESVSENIVPILGRMIHDPCFQEKWIEPYRMGRISKIEDIDLISLESCHIDLLKSLQVRANLVIPIILGYPPNHQLWGLFIVHQCQQPCRWTDLDIKIVQQMIVQTGITLDKFPQKEALINREECYRSIIDTMTEGIIFQNQTGQVIVSNENAERLLNVTKQEIKQLTSFDPRWQAIDTHENPFLPENYPPTVSLKTGKPQINVVMGVYQSNENITWLLVNSHPLFHPPSSQPHAVVTFFEDITDYKKAEQNFQQQIYKQNLVQQITQSIHRSLDVAQILQTTVTEVRKFLDTDRVIIYRLNNDGGGIIVAESVLPQWQSILNFEFVDSHLSNIQSIFSCQGGVCKIADIDEANLSPHHLELLEWLHVHAKIGVPVLQNDQAWGLLIAHHCRDIRQWQPFEEDLLIQLANQLAIAIHQAQLHQNIQNLALIDALTQIANRYCFERHIDREWQRLTREQSPLSLIFCDVDDFKQYNDTYGHPAGDQCLIQVARALQQVARRPTDLVARHGGEEFAIILPNTHQQGAIQVAQRLRYHLHQLRIPHEASTATEYVTLSMGIATLIPSLETHPSHLIYQADQALYEAKHQKKKKIKESLDFALFFAK